MAEKASKAVPAMAVAGVLVAAPHATTAARVSVSSAVIVGQAHAGALAGLHEPARRTAVRSGGTLSAVTDVLVVHHEPARRYSVRPGDTLSSIAQRFYGHAADWRLLYQANRSVVHDPDMIFPGEVLTIPGPVGERGYWQINTNHGSLSTYDPLGNARAAVIISANGTNWHPWTTFTSGAYRGRC